MTYERKTLIEYAIIFILLLGLAILLGSLLIGCSGEEYSCPDCGLNENCTPSEQGCIATSNADCTQSQFCRFSGACIAKDGACIVGSDADCKRSLDCETYGLCAQMDTALFPSCKQPFGTRMDTACFAGSDADCKRSWVCLYENRFLLKDGLCQ